MASGEVARASGAGGTTAGSGWFPAGSRTVKIEPRPTSLSTLISPCIRWQRLRLSARPSPVPPYFVAVETSATEGDEEGIVEREIVAHVTTSEAPGAHDRHVARKLINLNVPELDRVEFDVE